MENLQPMLDFYEVSDGDTRIGPAHISLYMALLRFWRLRGFETPLVINRKDVLQAARISQRTYLKCMKDLQAYGYISYQPSFNPFVPSKVFLAPYDFFKRKN